MNNEAVLLIEQAKLQLALELLAQALSSVQGEANRIAGQNEHDQRLGKRSETADVYSVLDTKIVQQRRRVFIERQGIYCSSSIPAADACEQCCNDFVYKHPIQTNIELLKDTMDGVYILCIILMFNLGLTHHLIAMEHKIGMGTSEEEAEKERRRIGKHLKNALRLYEMGFHMQMNGFVAMDITYALAMVNNCAVIYKALKRRRRAKKFYQHLLSSLVFLVEGGEAENIDEPDGFLMNASRLILRQNDVAAAA